MEFVRWRKRELIFVPLVIGSGETLAGVVGLVMSEGGGNVPLSIRLVKRRASLAREVPELLLKVKSKSGIFAILYAGEQIKSAPV